MVEGTLSKVPHEGDNCGRAHSSSAVNIKAPERNKEIPIGMSDASKKESSSRQMLFSNTFPAHMLHID